MPVLGISLYAYRQIILGVLLFTLIVDLRYKGFNNKILSNFVLLGLFWVAWGSASLFWAEDSTAALKDVASVVFGFLPIFIFSALNAFDGKSITVFRTGWLLAFLFASSVAVWELTTGNHLPGAWVDNAPPHVLIFVVLSTFGNPNNFAAFCVLVSSIFIVKLFSNITMKKRLFYFSLIGVTIIFSFIAGSRLSMASIPLLLLIMMAQKIPHKKVTFPILIIIGIVVSLIIQPKLSVMDSGGSEYSQGIEKISSEQVRINLAKVGMHFLFETNFVGVGAGNFPYWTRHNRAPYHTFGMTNPHNYTIEIISQYGLLVFMAFAAFFIGLGLVAIRGIKMANSIADSELMENSQYLIFGLGAYALASVSNSAWIAAPYNILFLTYLTILAIYISNKFYN
ncbi:MAG: hypothetical protein COB49_06430 [Alphaproteobacteria bacterium]|nr:MAG: hypothetical protein COB49_06430 [Alphaproteobacteria bacterium]